MTKDAYIKGVMQRMNELGWDDSFAGAFAGSDTTKAERHVESTFIDAWRMAVGLLPRDCFNQESFKDIIPEGDASAGTGFVVLPSDFYVLSLFKMRGWKKDCFAAFEETDAIAAIQSNDFVRGNFCRPVCTLSTHPRYGRIMKYYSLPKGDEHIVESALYIPIHNGITGLGGRDDLNLKTRLYEPLSWMSASMVFGVFEKLDLAKAAQEMVFKII